MDDTPERHNGGREGPQSQDRRRGFASREPAHVTFPVFSVQCPEVVDPHNGIPELLLAMTDTVPKRRSRKLAGLGAGCWLVCGDGAGRRFGLLQ
jgi:hypothetical protein